SWQYGSHLYRGLGRVDATFGATSFADAFRWLATHEPSRPISELQFWGHGKWGRIFVEGESLDRGVGRGGHAPHAGVRGAPERLSDDALLWFRTCEAFGASAGHDFAAALADATGARVAGHTFIIGFLQSGLHLLCPGERPSWSRTEGLAAGTADAPERALP